MRCAIVAALVAAVLTTGCTPAWRPEPDIAGKPVDEFVNDLKAELAEVHWRVRAATHACNTAAAREVDLRDAAVTLTLERVAQAGFGADLRLVAVPLGGLAVEPLASADASRRTARTLVMKLAVDGPVAVHDVTASTAGAAAAARGPVAMALNAAIDGFMRSTAQEPCVRLAGIKLTLVLDVERKAEGGFRIVVPAIRFAGAASSQAVNTLTLEWAHVASNGFL